MKRKLLTALFCLGAMFTFNMKSNAQSILIHYWHFNNYNQGAMYTPTIAAISADYTRITSPVAQVLYTTIPGTSAAYSSYLDSLTAITSDYDTVNLRQGQSGNIMIRARNPSDSMQLLFYLPATNYTNLQLKYGSESSSTTSGMLHQVFAYSLDGGTTWITSGTGLSEWTDSAWTTYNLIGVHFNDPLATGNPNLVFRITFSGNTALVKGNNRFDNITLEGDTITSSLGVSQLIVENHFTLYPNPVANSLTVNSDLDGVKYISITNVIGQNVYTGTAEGKNAVVNTADLSTGNYYITVRDNTTGIVNTMKFVKQ